MASTYLTRTPSSTGNRKTFTVSFWHKRGHLGNPNSHVTNINTGNNPYARIYFQTDDTLMIEDYDGSLDTNLKTNRKFRDMSAWYHIVVAYDTTQSQAADRVKIYVNGVQETSLATSTYPAQNFDTEYNKSGTALEIGRYSTNYLSGVFSHFHLIDGTAYDASAFGETDSTTGEWKIKTSPSVTYGTNGFFILKDGNSVTDQSGNSNNWTVGGGTLTKTEDNPSNVFATLNPLIYESRSNTFSNGNLKITGGVAGDWSTHYGVSTLGMSSGKYYVEAKITTAVGSQAMLGIIKTSQALSGSLRDIGTACIDAGGRISGGGSDFQTGLTSFASGDIAGASFDATNGTIQFYRNGSAYGNAISSIASDTYYFATNSYDTGAVVEFNFGNGYFGTTAVATNSGNGYAGAEGSSIFNYQPPTGYTALSTKGLNL
jgi:hypothetical protein